MNCASSEQIPTLAVPLARLHLLAGHLSEAFRIATNLVWSPATDNRSRQELLLINALAAHRMGEASTSARLARQALGLYRHTRTLAAFTVLDDDDLDLLLETAAGTAQYNEIAAIREQRRPYPSGITLIALTAREQLLARALGTTASRQQIADQLCVSLNTIKAQLLTLYRKLGVATREQALTQLAFLGLTINAPNTQALPTPDRQTTPCAPR
jgi:LuxR family maltose regulon positive regulatory protein